MLEVTAESLKNLSPHGNPLVANPEILNFRSLSFKLKNEALSSIVKSPQEIRSVDDRISNVCGASLDLTKQKHFIGTSHADPFSSPINSLWDVIKSNFKEKNLDSNSLKTIVKEVFETRLSQEIVKIVSLEKFGVSIDNIVENQVERVLKEIEKFGPQTILNYYTIAQQILESNNVPELDFITGLHLNIMPATLKNGLVQLASLRKAEFKVIPPKKYETEAEKTEEYYKALSFSIEFMLYAGENVNPKLAKIAESILKSISAVRDWTSVNTKTLPTSFELAQIFWPIRLGREIGNPEVLGLTLKQIDRYLKKILDKKLSSESSAFWFKKSVKDLALFDSDRDNIIAAITQSVLSSESEYRKARKNFQYQPVRFNVLLNDERLIKFEFNPNESQTVILDTIRQKIAGSKIIKISDQDKFNYYLESHKNPKKRRKDIYTHKRPIILNLFNREIKFGLNEDVSGDYLINLSSQNTDLNSPTSSFLCGNHKAVVDLNLSTDIFSAKFTHKFFDGAPADKFFTSIYQRLKKFGIDTESYYQPKYQKTEKRLVSSYPQMEVFSSMRDDVSFQKLSDLSPTVMRAMTIALANNIDDFTLLFSSERYKINEGPYDNIQPAIISFYPIKEIYKKFKREGKLTSDEKQKVKKWITMTKTGFDWAKNGLSIAATIAAPVGRAEELVAKVTKPLHPGVDLLKQTHGMFSGLVEVKTQTELEKKEFVTANGSTYRLRVNLEKPQISTGVIGYKYSQSNENGKLVQENALTVRKSPSQSQPAFRKYIDLSLYPGNQDRKIAYKHFTKLIEDWEKLTTGDINYHDYQKTLESTYNFLLRDKKCGGKKLAELGIYGKEDLQRRLNKVFQEDAKYTFNLLKINNEKRLFYSFLQAAI
ncbi:MAG: hypothetical protein WCT22_03675 [Patescibacteria group bacterium]